MPYPTRTPSELFGEAPGVPQWMMGRFPGEQSTEDLAGALAARQQMGGPGYIQPGDPSAGAPLAPEFYDPRMAHPPLAPEHMPAAPAGSFPLEMGPKAEAPVAAPPQQQAAPTPTPKPQPKQAARPAKQSKQRKQMVDTASSLFSKTATGAAGQQSEGFVSWGEMPEQVRKMWPEGMGAPAGWSLKKLDEKEQALLMQLMVKGRSELQQRTGEEAYAGDAAFTTPETAGVR